MNNNNCFYICILFNQIFNDIIDMFEVPYSTSANIGVAPQYSIASKDDIKFVVGTITLSPFLRFIALKAKCRADVQELTDNAYFTEINSENFFSSSKLFGPVEYQPLDNTFFKYHLYHFGDFQFYSNVFS